MFFLLNFKPATIHAYKMLLLPKCEGIICAVKTLSLKEDRSKKLSFVITLCTHKTTQYVLCT